MPQLYSKKVINDEQKEEIQKKTLKKDKVSLLFDVIKSELEVGISTKYDNLIKVMKASDDSTAKRLADLLEGKSCSFRVYVNTYVCSCMYMYVNTYNCVLLCTYVRI